MTLSSREYVDDLGLATAVADGSLQAWHEFVDRYSGVIVSVVRQYLEGFDVDDQRNVYVQTLEHFYTSGLAQYDGEASLGTWVITVARSRCLDFLRARHGRRREPPWLQERSKREREVYRLFFVERRSHGEILGWFSDRGRPLTQAELVEIVDRLDREIDPRVRTTLLYASRARTVGAVSGRLLRVLDALRLEAEQRADALRPDYRLLEAQTRDLVARIREYVVQLPEPERIVVEMHYFQEISASRIAERLDLPNARRAYTLLERGLRSLRRKLAADGHGQKVRGRPSRNEAKAIVEMRKEGND